MADIPSTDFDGSEQQRDRISIGDAEDLQERDNGGERNGRYCEGIKLPDVPSRFGSEKDGSLPCRPRPRQKRVLSNESQSFLNRFRTQTSSRSLNIPSSSHSSWNSFGGTDEDHKSGFFNAGRKLFSNNRNSSPCRVPTSSDAEFNKPRKWYSFSNLWSKQSVANLISIPRSRLSVSSTLNSVFLGTSSPTENTAFDTVNNFSETKQATYSSTSCIYNGVDHASTIGIDLENQPKVILRNPVTACYSASTRISDYVSDIPEDELLCEQHMTECQPTGTRHESKSNSNNNHRNGCLEASNDLLSVDTSLDLSVHRRTTLSSGECHRRSRLSCSEFFPNFPSVTESSEFDYSSNLPNNLTRERAINTVHSRKSIGRSLPTLLQAMESGHSSHGSVFPGYHSVTTQDVFDLLYHEFAILTGAKSVDDHYVIVFPDRGNFHLLAEHDYRRLMCYLTSIPPMEESEAGFVLIIDRRNDKWSSMKYTLLRLSTYFPGVIHRVLVLRPTSFLQKALTEVTSKIFRGDALRFSLTVCNSVSDLLVHVNSDQLTLDFGGCIKYDKAQWARQRIDVEAFEAALKHLSKELKCFTDSFVDLEHPNDTASTKALMDAKNAECQRLQLELLHASQYGEELLVRIKTGSSDPQPQSEQVNSQLTIESSSQSNSMQLINVISVERFILQIEETGKLFEQFWSKEKLALEQCLKLREFEQRFKDLQVCYDAHFQKLSAVADMGDGVSTTEILIEATLVFQNSVTDDIKCALELEGQGRNIVAGNPASVDTVEPKCIELNRMATSLTDALNDKLKSQKEWREVQSTVERANKLCQEGMDLISSKVQPDESGDCLDSGSTLKKIDAFLEIVQTISSDVSSTKSMLSSATTTQCRNLLKQVQKRVDDLQAMLLKKRALVVQHAANLRLRRNSECDNKDDISVVDNPNSGLVRVGKATVFPAESSLGVRKLSHGTGSGIPESNGQNSDLPCARKNSGPLNDGSAENKRLKRGHILKELLSTESTYVQEMGDILSGYREDIDRLEISPLLPPQLTTTSKQGVRTSNMGVLFGNLDEIHKFHCSKFYPDLSNCITSLELVGLCFIQRHLDFLALYSRYCQMLPASENLRREIGENHPWFITCRQKLNHKLPLGAYLLKPVQRITKYQLLLKDLLKYSEDCEGYSVLQNALENMLIVLRCVNDGMLQLSIVGYPGQLMDEGPLLLQGSFMMWTETKKDKLRLKGHQRHLFLYQKCILICKKDKDPKSASLYLKNRIDLSEIGLTEALRGNASTKKFEIWIQGRLKVFIFQAENQDIKDTWVHSIKKLLMEQLESLRLTKATNDNSSQKPNISTKRHKMIQSKGMSLNGWRAGSLSHRPLRPTSSWTENRNKLGNNPSDIEGDDDASSGLSNSEDEDSVSVGFVSSSESQSSVAKRTTLLNCQKSTSSSFGNDVLPAESMGLYVALADYNAVGAGEISFTEGEMFVLRKTGIAGWWFISSAPGSTKRALEGWAPSAFLECVSHSERVKPSIEGSASTHHVLQPCSSKSAPSASIEASNELKDEFISLDSVSALR